MTQRDAAEIAASILGGVGDSDAGDRVERGHIAIHVRRALTDEEARGLAAFGVRPPFWTPSS